jgi:extradiol dioxygenase family protein
MITPFHLAIPVIDVSSSRKFYGEILGCPEGRSSDQWVDFNLFGHQLVCHQVESSDKNSQKNENVPTNPVDGHDVPVPHFGVVLDMEAWQILADKLIAADVEFLIEPYVRFKGEPGEQATMFFRDPSGNALEFKAFRDIESELFKTT